MGRRKTYKEVDFADLNDIILYAYGRERNIRSKDEENKDNNEVGKEEGKGDE